MIIDSAIYDFMNKYDREAIMSIQEFSNNADLKKKKFSMKLFNLTEAFNTFDILISNWGKYQIKVLHEDSNFTQEQARTETFGYVDKSIFKEELIPIQEIGSFVENYLIRVKGLSTLIDNLKKQMLKENVNQHEIASVNDLADHFMTQLNKKFTESMDILLTASGYKTKKMLSKDYYELHKNDHLNENIII